MRRPGARTKPAPVGPGRWGYRHYHIHERASPLGRRYEIRTPQKQLVAMCRIKRGNESLTFFSDADESTELMRFVPKSVRQFAVAYEVLDGTTGKPLAEFRKKVYRPLNKSEWFIVDPEGEPLGMVTESASGAAWWARLVPLARLRPRAFDVHWGQAIGGRIQRRPALWGMDHLEVDLSLDKREAVDRRLALGVAVLVREMEGNGEKPNKKGA